MLRRAARGLTHTVRVYILAAFPGYSPYWLESQDSILVYISIGLCSRAAAKLHKLLTSIDYQLSGYAIPASMKLL